MKLSGKIFLAAALIFSSTLKTEAKIFTFEASTGIKTGIIREFVFDNHVTDTLIEATKRTLSRLDWKTDVIPYITIAGKLDLKNVILGADLLFGFGGKEGIMEDWDWLGKDRNRATHYSRHDLDNRYYFEAHIKAGYNFILPKTSVGTFSLTPMAGFMFRNTKYDGNDGYKQYASNTGHEYWEEDLPKVGFTGTVITYEQKTYLPYLRLEANWNFKKDFNWKIFTNYSPYIWCNAVDDHKAETKKISFRDEMKGGFLILAGTEFFWKMVGFGFTYEFYSVKSGKTGKKDSSTGGKYIMTSSTPGTESSFFNFYVKVRL